MLTIENSQREDPIFKWNGRSLSSAVDPRAEAVKWLEARRKSIASAKSVIILGAGSGYHVSTLWNEFPEKKIVLVDPRKTLIDALKSEHRLAFSEVRCVPVYEASQIIKNTFIRRALSGSYSVQRHPPSIFGYKELFQDIEDILCARHLSGLISLLELRPQLMKVVNLNAIRKRYIDDPEYLASIKDLNDVLTSTALNQKEAIFIKILRELVK